MSDDPTLFELPLARRGDPETSYAAARDASVHASAGRLLAMRYLTHGGYTDYELADATGWQQNSIGKRRGELMNAGLVRAARENDGAIRKRPAPSGSMAIVWEATERGLRWFMDNA